METKLIECKHIDVPEAEPATRSFSKGFATKLARSIKIDGLYNPIVVRPSPAAPGRYILVQGKNRLFATKKVLKEQFIRATVIKDMDAAEAELAAVVENIWRNPLNKAQLALGMQTWYDHWFAKNPPLTVKATPPDPEWVGAETEKCQSGNSGTRAASPEPVADQVADRTESSFDNTASAATGRSLRSVRRTKSLGKTFNRDQLEVFVQMQVNETDMTTIAKIKNIDKRAEVVDLISSGMEPSEAIKEVMKDNAPVRDNGSQTKAERETKQVAKAEVHVELTDDEWFELYCGEKAAMLGDPARFKSDALLFRAVSEARHTLRVQIKGELAETKRVGNIGPVYALLNRAISMSHPRDFLLCGVCAGKGTKDGEKCGRCFGAGYQIKTEEYL